MTRRAVLGMFWLVACGDDTPADGQLGAVQCAKLSVEACRHESGCQLISEDGGSQRCGEERIGQRSCGVLSVEECKLDARCQTIDGRAFDEDRMCMNTSEPKGCQERGSTCPPAVIYARDTALNSYEFASGCWPTGYERFQPLVPPERTWPSCELRAGECEAHQPAECASDMRCTTIVGSLLDETKQCVGDSTPLRCMKRMACTAALVVARDPQGRSWWFSSGCIPADYQSDASSPAVNWDLCNPQPPSAPKPCIELRGDDCEVDRTDCTAIQAIAYEPDLRCVRGMKKVGCMPKSQGCTTAITYGRDAQGQDWQFPSGCQPVSFASFNPSADEMLQGSWPGCSN